MARTTFVLWCCSSCKDYCRAVPHVASRERCAAPPVARGGRRAALDAGSYRTLLERLALEQLVMAAPEPRHLTSLAPWSAGPTQRLVREVKTRLDARSVFHSCWRPPRNLPRTTMRGS